MSVDKFGRYSHSKGKGLRGPKGEGFNLTPDGDYDIQTKRLRNVGEPSDDLDAVNLKTHVNTFRDCISKQDGVFDGQNTRIRNIAQPIASQDAVTKEYMESRIPLKLESSYSLNQYRMQDVAPPVDDSDAVNLNYVKTNTICKTESGTFDAKGQLIQNVGTPVGKDDAVNLSYLKSNTFVKTSKGVFDANKAAIKNLALPTNGGDASNKSYVDRHTLIRGATAWNCRDLKLSHVSAPTSLHDVVTLDYLQKHTIGLVEEQVGEKGKSIRELSWNVGVKRLTNLKKPLALKDAVNKAYLKEALADLAFALYKVIKSGERASLSIEDEDNWKKQVVEEKTSWDVLFGDEIPIYLDESGKAGILQQPAPNVGQ